MPITRSPLEQLYTEMTHALHKLNETDIEINSAKDPQAKMEVLQKQYQLVKGIDYRCRLRYRKIVADAEIALEEVKARKATFSNKQRKQLKEKSQIKEFDNNNKVLALMIEKIKEFITTARRAVIGKAIKRNEIKFR